MKLARTIYRSSLLSSTFSKTFLHSFAPYQTLQIAIVNHCRLHLPLLALVYGLLVNQHWPILVLVLELSFLFFSRLSLSLLVDSFFILIPTVFSGSYPLGGGHPAGVRGLQTVFQWK